MRKNNELSYYLALRTIAKEYMSREQLQRQGPKEYGVSYYETLEMAYDNIQAVASDAIRGKRVPSPAPAKIEDQCPHGYVWGDCLKCALVKPDWCDICNAPQNVLPTGEHACKAAPAKEDAK